MPSLAIKLNYTAVHMRGLLPDGVPRSSGFMPGQVANNLLTVEGGGISIVALKFMEGPGIISSAGIIGPPGGDVGLQPLLVTLRFDVGPSTSSP